MAEQGVDDVAAELYSVPPGQFVAARDEAVRLARGGGDRELAREIGRLRRPTVAAWAVNILVRAAGARVDELIGLGERLRVAQQRLQGEQLRWLNQQRRESIGALVRRARELAADAGQPLSSAVLVEVEQTLVAALFDPASAEEVREGQLTKSLQHVGMGVHPLLPFGPEAAPSGGAGTGPKAQAAGATATAGTPGRTPGTPGTGHRPAVPPVAAPEDEVARRRRRRELRRERELQRATIELEQAGTRLERAEQEAREAEERSATAERQLAELRRERDKAVQERDEAQRRARSAARVRDDAKRRVQRLTEQAEQP